MVLVNIMRQRFISILLLLTMVMSFAHAEVVEPVALELAGQNDMISPTIRLSNDDLLWLAKKVS